MPACLGPQEKADAAPVGCEYHAFGNEPVGRIRLVRRALEQALERQARARRAHPLQCEGAERAEGVDRGEVQQATLGRVGVDVVEVGEVGSVLEIPEEREPVGRLLRCRGSDQGRERRHRRRSRDGRTLNEASSAEFHWFISL